MCGAFCFSILLSLQFWIYINLGHGTVSSERVRTVLVSYCCDFLQKCQETRGIPLLNFWPYLVVRLEVRGSTKAIFIIPHKALKTDLSICKDP